MMKKYAAALLTVCLLLVSACGSAGEEPRQEETTLPQQTTGTSAPESSSQIPESSEELETGEANGGQEETQPSAPEDMVQRDPETKDDISQILLEAMEDLREQAEFDIAGMTWEFGAENDLKNIYYAILSDHGELKYTYDMEVSISGDTAVCTFSYMPYMTGAYDDGVPEGTGTIGSLYDARALAQGMTDGTERMPVAITNPSLLIDDIQRALAQAGYGWIVYNLSEDGTELTAEAPVGKSMDECVSAIRESFRLCDEIVSERVTGSMTEEEKIKALYDYIAGNVAYDFRYYSDRENMPYESTVAIGALRDHLAICGGYAQAFEMLLDSIGVENYTVSGIYRNEYHMWNYVVLDGVGYYCDPTSDRGGMSNHFMLTVEQLTADGDYSWDHEFLQKISGAADRPE